MRCSEFAKPKRNIPVLLGGFLSRLVSSISRAWMISAGVAGADDAVDIAAFGRNVGIGKAVAELLDFLGAHFGEACVAGESVDAFLGGPVELAPIDDFDRALRSHDGNFGGWPGVVHVAANVLGAHDAIGSAVSFAGDDGDLGHSGFGKGVEQLGAVHDDAAVLLLHTGKEAGNIVKGDQRNVEAVAEADKARALDRGADIEHSGEEVG